MAERTCLVCGSEIAPAERITCDECYVGGAFLTDNPDSETALIDPNAVGTDRSRT